MSKILMIALVGLLAAAIYYFSRPLPGQLVSDLGQEHVAVGSDVEYNSNPPTSGPHYETPADPGKYDLPVEDGYLVHSLEHGYVIISYNCEFKPQAFGFINIASAHDGEDHEEGELKANALEGDEWNSSECGELKSNLSKSYDSFGEWKLIMVPRPGMDAKIALTAWGRIDKFNAFDEERISKFVKSFQDRGPEKTME